MKIAILAVAASILLLAAASGAEAETFDCSRPTLALGKLICGDAQLRAADEEESEIYDTALFASLDRPMLREDERAWFEREILVYNWFAEQRVPIDDAKIVAAYRDRADALRAQEQLWRKTRRPVPGASLAASCFALPPFQPAGECDVAELKPIAGEPSLRYQLQTYDKRLTHSAVIVFAPVPDRADDWVPIAVAYSEYAMFAAPRIVVSPYGKLLLIPGTQAGTAANNGSALYRLDDGVLEDIDNRSWLDSFGSELPLGLRWDHGIFPDYAKMVAETQLSRPGDSNCCPTGDRYRIDLAIENDAVVIKSISPETAPAASGDRAN